MAEMTFEIGDRVQCIKTCSGGARKGNTGTFRLNHSGELIIDGDNRNGHCIHFDNWRKVGKSKSTNNIMQKLTSTLKRALSPALQVQYKAGLINGELELTTEGRNELLSILVVANEKEFTAVAKEIIVEAEK